MDLVERPQPFPLMHRTVHPVLHKVGRQEEQRKAHPGGQVVDQAQTEEWGITRNQIRQTQRHRDSNERRMHTKASAVSYVCKSGTTSKPSESPVPYRDK